MRPVRSPRYDVIVVGGGPAGCSAAITAARGGARVLLLERDAEARDRPGETFHPGIEPLLTRLGAGEALHAATELRHDGHWVRLGGRRRFQAFGRDESGPWRGFQARRSRLDAGLRACAAEAGAERREGVAVSEAKRARDGRVIGVITSAGERIPAGVVIDASGGRHWLARRLGIGVRRLSPRYIATYGYGQAGGLPRGPAPPTEPEFHLDRTGWTWIAPVAPGRWHWTRLSFGGRRTPPDWIPRPLAAVEPCGPSRGADMTWRVARTVAGPGWALAGDAAAVLDPASSHGVLRAVLTGEAAGRLALDRSPEAWLAYDAWLKAAVTADIEALRSLYPPSRRREKTLPTAGADCAKATATLSSGLRLSRT